MASWCRASAVGVLCLAAACDLPTAPPKWETTWLAPLTQLEVPIAEFLPAAVTVAEDHSEFVVAFDGVAFAATLRELCDACGALDGTTSPKPGFSAALAGVAPLPLDLESATMTRGRLVVDLTNGFSFDPVRGDGAVGRIITTVSSGGATLMADTIDGAREAFPPGITLRREIGLMPITVSSGVRVSVSIESPPGEPAEIDADRTFGVRVFPFELGASEAVIRFAPREVAIVPTGLDFAGVTADFVRRVHGGALILGIGNPFGVDGALAIELAAPRGTVSDTLVVAPGAISHRIDLSADELRLLLNSRDIVVTAAGTMRSETGTLTLRPTQSVRFTSRFEVVLGPKGP